MNALAKPYDVSTIRKDFAILGREVYGKKLVYLDNPGSVADNWREYFDQLQHAPATDGQEATRDQAHAPVVESFAQRARANAFLQRAAEPDLAALQTRLQDRVTESLGLTTDVETARGVQLHALRRGAGAPPERQLELVDERLRRAHVSGAAGHEYLPRTVTVLPDAPGGGPDAPAFAPGPGIVVESASRGYPELRATVSVIAPGDLVLQQFWFPGWRVEVDGVERPARAEADRGRIVVALTPGDREVVARFGPTPLRRAALVASGLSLCALFLIAARAPARKGS